MTPAKIGPRKFTVSRQRSRSSKEKLTCTNRKSASLLPRRQRAQGGTHPDAKWLGCEGRVRTEPPGFVDHRANREIVGPSPCLGPIAVDEKKLVDPVRRSGEQVALEAENVAIPGVQTRDRASAHQRHLVGDSDARHRRPTDVIVGDQERRRDAAHHADLVSHVHQIGARGRLHFADDAELVGRHDPTVRSRPGPGCTSRDPAGSVTECGSRTPKGSASAGAGRPRHGSHALIAARI